MDLSQFPERFRARVLSSIVRHGRMGIAIRFGRLEGETLPLLISRQPTAREDMSPAELEAVAREAFSTLPYHLRIKIQ